MSNSFVKHEHADLILSLTIQPKSSKDQVVGEHNGRCKVRITAPPVDGKANLHLIRYLAKLFRVCKSQVIIEKGETSKHKQVRIIEPTSVPAVFDVSGYSVW